MIVVVICKVNHRLPDAKPNKKQIGKTKPAIDHASCTECLVTTAPGTGIWGGLFSFPEFSDISEAQQNWLQQQGYTELAIQP